MLRGTRMSNAKNIFTEKKIFVAGATNISSVGILGVVTDE